MVAIVLAADWDAKGLPNSSRYTLSRPSASPLFYPKADRLVNLEAINTSDTCKVASVTEILIARCLTASISVSRLWYVYCHLAHLIVER